MDFDLLGKGNFIQSGDEDDDEEENEGPVSGTVDLEEVRRAHAPQGDILFTYEANRYVLVTTGLIAQRLGGPSWGNARHTGDYNAARNILYCFLYERAFAERPRPFRRV
ncbi:hypothetical protein SeLEV6574_g01153 [Synchytrium endobioticum]|uniref:Uncharacterized protein n=1 Tax=Synchytrium endobioticum TaxID=286115 RepID=A0A507DE84_9FUNG|nr:hypothetical protein SeLEV6574_g01153 [Synchytrium endobioticum]